MSHPVHRSVRARAASTLILVTLAGLTVGCQHADRAGDGSPAWVREDNSVSRWPDSPVAVIDGVEQPAPRIKMGEPRVVAAILAEGKYHNEVMTHLTALTDIGPRLTGSSNLERAQHWANGEFQSWGYESHLDQWGTINTRFDRGPSHATVWMPEQTERPRRPGGRPGDASPAAPAAPTTPTTPSTTDTSSTTHVGSAPSQPEAPAEPPPAEPKWHEVRTMEFTWLAWTGGTSGPVRGTVIKLPDTDEQYAKLKSDGKLAGSWILLPPPPPVGQRGVRSRLQTVYDARTEARQKVAAGETKVEELPIRERLIFDNVAGFISTSRDERVWTGGLQGGRDMNVDQIPRDVQAVVRLSDYDYLNSRLVDDEPVQVEMDMNATLVAGPLPVYNVVAEIRGATKPDEVVIVSGHMDSWDGPGSRGTLDNGTGSSVTLEAARILATALKKTGARPIRTIRFVLWSGEEQGLLGSAGYVKSLKEAGKLDGVSACFVDDGGTNWEGGVTAADNMVDMLAAATSPVNNQFWDPVGKVWMNVDIKHGGESIQVHGGSDHASFNKEGVPGFFWDEVGRSDYQYGWHTQNDKPDLAIPEYLAQSSTNAAITAYNLAMADTLLPRGAKVEPMPTRVSGPNLPGRPEGTVQPSTPAR